MRSKEVEEGIGHLEWLLDKGILTTEDEPYIKTVLSYISELEEICKKQEHRIIEDDIPKQMIRDKIKELSKKHNNLFDSQIVLKELLGE